MLKRIDYYSPENLDEAVELLQNPKAKVFAGGTDLVVSMRNGAVRPSLLVDIKGIKELKTLKIAGNELIIGSAITVNELVESPEVRGYFPILAEAGASLASYQVRNRATVVGNLCNASPAADMAPALLVLDAKLDVYGKSGQREIPLKELFTGVKKTSLSSDEIVTRIRVPLTYGIGRYLKKSRSKGHDLSAVGVAGFCDGKKLKLAVGACAVTPVSCELNITGMKRDDILDAARQKIREIINPIDDIRAGKEYRIAIVDVYLERILDSILQQEGDAV